MKEIRKLLTKQEQALLADLWEDKPTLHALQTVLSQRQLHLAIDTMATAPNWENVVENRGKVSEGKWVNNFLEDNFKKTNESRNQA